MSNDLRHLDEELLMLFSDPDLQDLADRETIASAARHLSQCHECEQRVASMKTALVALARPGGVARYEQMLESILATVESERHSTSPSPHPNGGPKLVLLKSPKAAGPSLPKIQKWWAIVAAVLCCISVGGNRSMFGVPEPLVLKDYYADPIQAAVDYPLRAEAFSSLLSKNPHADSTAIRDNAVVIAMLAKARGQEGAMRVALRKVVDLDPRASVPRADLMPAGLLETYAMLQADRLQELDGRPTVTIGSFRAKPMFADSPNRDLEALADGMALVVLSDLRSCNSIRVIQDLQLREPQRETVVYDAEQRSLPRQSRVFGHVFQFQSDSVEIALRWVDGNTGALLWAGKVAGATNSNSDAFRVEQRLICQGLVPAMATAFGQAQGGEGGALERKVAARIAARREGLTPRASYWNLITTMGFAIQADYDEDFGHAARLWRKVCAQSPADREAGARARGLSRYARMRDALQIGETPTEWSCPSGL